MMIIDSGLHIWRASTPERPWMPGRTAHLPEPISYENLRGRMKEAGVDRAILIPPSWEGDSSDYSLEASARYPDRFAVMGRIPIDKPEGRQMIETWKEQPGMLGVRISLLSDATIGWLTDGTADWFWPAAEKAGLPVMFLVPGQLSMFARIAERHPQLTLIIDHMGLNSSSRTARITAIPAAIDQAVALAKYPNVGVKLSGAPGNSLESYPFRDMTVYLQRLFEAYGPERCYWGTDITNSFAKATYRQRVTHFTEELSFLSESDKDWVMGRAILARLKWA